MKKYIIFILINILPVLVTAQIINTVAGNGSSINTGDGSAATSAGIDIPGNAVFDKYGNCYLTVTGNKIRKISPTGIITTVVGTGVGGFSGDGGPATAAKIKNPQQVIVDTI